MNYYVLMTFNQHSRFDFSRIYQHARESDSSNEFRLPKSAKGTKQNGLQGPKVGNFLCITNEN